MSRRFGLPGQVYIVGIRRDSAAADSLSEQAVSVLQRAEVVFHEEFVSARALEHVPISSLVLNVGQSGLSEAQINERMISFVDEGKIVVRLTDSDSVTWARIQEETQALRDAKIEVELVRSTTAPAAAAVA